MEIDKIDKKKSPRKFNERTPTQSVRGIVRSAKELHSGLIPLFRPRGAGY